MRKMKVVFHLDFDDTPAFELALVNITNFLKDVEDAEVVLLANGFAVKLFVKSSAKKFAEKLEELSRKGVKFYVCNNALNAHIISREDVFEFCEIVPAGVTKLVELQESGYAYIKP
jgi:hypothetical protein